MVCQDKALAIPAPWPVQLSYHWEKLEKRMKIRIQTMRRFVGMATVVLTAVIMSHVSAMASTYYAATTGSDSNTGTLDSPFRTISKGISRLSAGDTVYIRAGSYGETINIPIPSGTSFTNAVTISSYPGETVILRGFGFNSGESYIIVNGLTLDAQKASGQPLYISRGSHHLRFTNCDIKNGTFGGVVTATPQGGPVPGFLEFINCKVHDNGTAPRTDHGFYLQSSNNLIDGCEVYNNAAYGIQLQPSGSTASGNVVRNNRVHHNSRVGEGGGIVIGTGTQNVLSYNNIVYSNGGYAAIQVNGNSGAKIYNNTVYGNSAEYGIQYFNNSNLAIRNNIVYASGPSFGDFAGNTGVILSNNMISDPKLVNAAGADFRLQSSSPAIDAGVSFSEILTDLEGISRPQGSAYDIGAFENQSSVVTAVPPSNLRILP
jgi:parallel beta-helix repeat protein